MQKNSFRDPHPLALTGIHTRENTVNRAWTRNELLPVRQSGLRQSY